MTTSTPTDVASIDPIDHRAAMALAAVEFERFGALLAALGPDDWTRSTDCPAWDVRAMVAHVVGAMAGNASMRENLRQLRLARKGDGPLVDELSALQVADRAADGPDALLAEYERLVTPAVKGRTRVPGPVRSLARMDVEMPYGTERWTLGYLVDTIYTRDVWMHRVDIARATGRPLELTADHDGRLVADVVAEWARRHGSAFTLVLDGPAGGAFVSSGERPAEELCLDAVEFARTVAGREPGVGLLATAVAF
ncbi:MAG: maleylpyruvate isomerase family mycothiol-dependent enzyme [Acidimicrobiales bacterium]|nr:maleylpyruvate isomerase family mycothiol-dependent enzyme [Acidimicrobiales bacterium]